MRLVQAAWEHFSEWQEIGGRCAASPMPLLVARSLLIEAVEEWALALSRLLGIAQEDGLEHLAESLEQSLNHAASYLSRVAASGDSDSAIYVQFSR